MSQTHECRGITQKGKKCTKKIRLSSLYCGLHDEATDILNSESHEQQEIKTRKKTICKGITLQGHKCSKTTEVDSLYCKYHNETTDKRNKKSKNSQNTSRCQGSTKKGNRCTRKPLVNSKYCKQHKPIYDYQEERKRQDQKYGYYYYSQPVYQNITDKFSNSILNSKYHYLTQIQKNKIDEAIVTLMIDIKSLSTESIRKSYLRNSIKHHPDKGGDAETFKKILNSKETLETFLIS